MQGEFGWLALGDLFLGRRHIILFKGWRDMSLKIWCLQHMYAWPFIWVVHLMNISYSPIQITHIPWNILNALRFGYFWCFDAKYKRKLWTRQDAQRSEEPAGTRQHDSSQQRHNKICSSLNSKNNFRTAQQNLYQHMRSLHQVSKQTAPLTTKGKHCRVDLHILITEIFSMKVNFSPSTTSPNW